MVEDTRSKLEKQFRKQEQFSSTYSPFYAAFFGTIADWLGEQPPSEAAMWLTEAAVDLPVFDVTLLLAAGLHRDVLAGVPAAAPLSLYYPSVGGEEVATEMTAGGPVIKPVFKEVLAAAILSRRDELNAFLHSHTVQTNETGRGLAWLLPAASAGLGQIHLLDLGASAGLNLVADERRFTLLDDNAHTLTTLGHGREPEFEVAVKGWPKELGERAWSEPTILSRTGGDLYPFALATEEDAQTLASFVWADQIVRLQRLNEGIAALQKVNKTGTAVRLHRLSLPEELPAFLAGLNYADESPVICYNTYIRMYLAEKGSAMRHHLAAWAKDQARPLIWIQWEPTVCLDMDVGHAPAYAWLAWTVDLWHEGDHKWWLLGFVHPHGQQVKLADGFGDWIAYWEQRAENGRATAK